MSQLLQKFSLFCVLYSTMTIMAQTQPLFPSCEYFYLQDISVKRIVTFDNELGFPRIEEGFIKNMTNGSDVMRKFSYYSDSGSLKEETLKIGEIELYGNDVKVKFKLENLPPLRNIKRGIRAIELTSHSGDKLEILHARKGFIRGKFYIEGIEYSNFRMIISSLDDDGFLYNSYIIEKEGEEQLLNIIIPNDNTYQIEASMFYWDDFEPLRSFKEADKAQILQRVIQYHRKPDIQFMTGRLIQ